MALASGKRQRAYISRLKAGIPTASKPRKPIDRRTKPKRWDDAVAELLTLLYGYRETRDNPPDGLAETAYLENLDAILGLRELVGTERVNDFVTAKFGIFCDGCHQAFGHADWPTPRSSQTARRTAVGAERTDTGRLRVAFVAPRWSRC